MSAGDLGFSLGVIVAAVASIKIYASYGLLAAIGAFFGISIVAGIILAIFLGLIFSLF